MLKTKFIILATAVFLSACSTHENPYETQSAATTTYVPVRLAHEFYSSWGHDGRGGAALRKPAYQHVMGSEEMVMTTHGNYADLRSGNGAPPGDSVIVTALNGGMNSAIDKALSVAPERPITTTSIRPPLQATEAEYLIAYRKFCKGAGSELTEREWELVARGGPKGIPPSLRGKCLQMK